MKKIQTYSGIKLKNNVFYTVLGIKNKELIRIRINSHHHRDLLLLLIYHPKTTTTTTT
jgi:hypothetical protein